MVISVVSFLRLVLWWAWCFELLGVLGVAADGALCNGCLVHLDDFRVTRRGLLRVGGISAALLTVSRLRALPALAATGQASADATLRVLSPDDARILSAIAGRITFTGEPSMPRFADTAGLQVIDGALRQLPPAVAQQVSWGLWLFEYGPPIWIGKLSTFTGLSDEWQDAYIAGWAESRFQMRRTAFQAFKNLSMLGYYSQDATWPAIHYQGPWVPRPRRVLPEA
jgi:hypothetical protein